MRKHTRRTEHSLSDMLGWALDMPVLWFWSSMAWIWFSTPHLPSCVTLGKWLMFLCFLPCNTGIRTDDILLARWNVIVHVMFLANWWCPKMEAVSIVRMASWVLVLHEAGWRRRGDDRGGWGSEGWDNLPRVPRSWLLPSGVTVPDVLRRREPTFVLCPVSIQALISWYLATVYMGPKTQKELNKCQHICSLRKPPPPSSSLSFGQFVGISFCLFAPLVRFSHYKVLTDSAHALAPHSMPPLFLPI